MTSRPDPDRYKPRYERLEIGEDPVGFIVSANLARRHISVGQRAMLYAIAYPEPERGKRTDLSGKSDKLELGVSRGHAQNLLSQARAVLREAPDLTKDVIAGACSLDDAYRKANMRDGAHTMWHCVETAAALALAGASRDFSGHMQIFAPKSPGFERRRVGVGKSSVSRGNVPNGTLPTLGGADEPATTHEIKSVI
jgi:hypothetical protein